ncbi:hypothetical protein [Magnetospirillum fulvum]|uniref:Uncharacterized protein n=1 Tax=Magnetospirillum fulvum TaxID=1082 RepID=A0A1H6JZ33_MAGFU|nr:hypothetical protein [Magnetospirillum fulvum]SEH65277.1 hypothetical protein SAMN04244559_03320 [Magnetospirillum fulvum]
MAVRSGIDAAIEITAGFEAGNTVQFGRQRATFASGIEARRAETPQGGSVYESPAREFFHADAIINMDVSP